jgi:dCMP deaminase
VLHAGYEALLAAHPDAEVLLLGPGFADEFPVLRKDIRALPAATAARYLGAVRDSPVRVVEPAELPTALTGDELVVSDEEIMRELVDRLDLAAGRRLTWHRTFLRWDRGWSQPARPVDHDVAVATDGLARVLTARAAEAAGLSSDWWRQVGALAARDGVVLDVAHNEHRPTEYAPYLDGDPRNDFSRGVRPDLSTAIHAEALLVARAARDGRSLLGADLYVSTFPCPACARLVADTGFRRCYFAGPYALLDGDAVLRAAGVELFWVDLTAGAAS